MRQNQLRRLISVALLPAGYAADSCRMEPDAEDSDPEAAQRMIDTVGTFPFEGIAFYLNGKPAAAAGGFPLSPETFGVCFVKDSRGDQRARRFCTLYAGEAPCGNLPPDRCGGGSRTPRAPRAQMLAQSGRNATYVGGCLSCTLRLLKKALSGKCFTAF